MWRRKIAGNNRLMEHDYGRCTMDSDTEGKLSQKAHQRCLKIGDFEPGQHSICLDEPQIVCLYRAPLPEYL